MIQCGFDTIMRSTQGLSITSPPHCKRLINRIFILPSRSLVYGKDLQICGNVCPDPNPSLGLLRLSSQSLQLLGGF